MTYGHVDQQEAARILNNLKSRIIPKKPEILNSYTVGDRFFLDSLKLKSEILNLLTRPEALERLIIGDFGTGKTHFLHYLDWILRSDLKRSQQTKRDSVSGTASCVITHVNLVKLKEPADLEYLIIEGMQMVDEPGDWTKVLKKAHINFNEKVKKNDKLGLVTDRNLEHFVSVVIFSILGNFTEIIFSDRVFESLKSKRPLKKISYRLPFNNLKKIYRQATESVDQDCLEFIETFNRTIAAPDKKGKGLKDLRIVMKKLSGKSKLIDVVFRIMALGGIDLIVVLVDELEQLGGRDKENSFKVLDAIRNFRDNLDLAGRNLPGENTIFRKEGCGYPAVAFISASTDLFFDVELEKINKALHSRWNNEEKQIRLEPLSSADIDNLIFRLRKLCYFAGISLKPVEERENGVHEVIELRKSVMKKLRSDLEKKPMTNRDIIPALISAIEQSNLEQTINRDKIMKLV